jgi:putative SOS response-associated peptidase YedK
MDGYSDFHGAFLFEILLPYNFNEISFLYLNRRPLKLGPLKPNFNMSPTHNVPTLRLVDGTREIDTMQWGLIPEWSPEFKMTLFTINARSEVIHASRLYKKTILQRRCIVPVSGFFEWKREGKEKPGIWTAWRAGTREEQHSFSIMTTAANSFMEKIHDRMPVILDA